MASWRKLATRGQQYGLAATLVVTVIGGWLHTIDARIPWVLTALAFVAATLIIWPVKDMRPQNARGNFKEEVAEYWRDITTGFRQFRLPQLWPYVPLILTVQALFYVTGYGLLRVVLLDRFTFDPFWGSVALAVCGAITVGALAVIQKKADTLQEKHILVLISLAAAAALLLATANIGLWGFAVIFLLYAGEYILQPLMSDVLNKHAPERHRATVLSVGSFLRMLPYVLLAPIIGSLNAQGQLHYFLFTWAALIVAAVIAYLLTARRSTKISIGTPQ